MTEKFWNFHNFELWFFYVKLNKIVTWTLKVVWNPQYLEVPKMEDHKGQDWTSFWHYYSEFFHELSDNHHNPRLLVFSLVVDSNMNSAPLDHSTHRLSNLPVNGKSKNVNKYLERLDLKHCITYICLAFTANNTCFAIITSPTFFLKMLNQISTVNSTRRVYWISTAIARNECFFFTHWITFVCSKTFHTDG